MGKSKAARVAKGPAPNPAGDSARRAWSAMCDLVLDNERRREVSDAVDLTFGRIRALRRIARTPVTMGELAGKLGIDAPYATLVVDELERQGLVERRPHPSDRRAKLVTTTTRGASVALEAEEIMNRPPVGLTSLSGSELESLATILEHARAEANIDPRT
ncbi:MAG: MarR family transcriptional regulator [Acidimicrobiales bacterium]